MINTIYEYLKYKTNQDCSDYIFKLLHQSYMKDISEHILPPTVKQLPYNWIHIYKRKIGRKYDKILGKKGEVYDGICFDYKKNPVYNYLKIRYSIPLFVRYHEGKIYFNELIDMEAKLNSTINNYCDWCPWWMTKIIRTKLGCILHPLEIVYWRHSRSLLSQRNFMTEYLSDNTPYYARPPCINNYMDRYEIKLKRLDFTDLINFCRINNIVDYQHKFSIFEICNLIMKNLE